jgi:hypothetical protein
MRCRTYDSEFDNQLEHDFWSKHFCNEDRVFNHLSPGVHPYESDCQSERASGSSRQAEHSYESDRQFESAVRHNPIDRPFMNPISEEADEHLGDY